MDFKKLVMERYATKLFDGKTIPKEKFDELLEHIRYAPSSFNLQPWKIKIVTDKKTKEALFAASWNQEQITSCSHLLVFCADARITHLIDQLESMLKGKMPDDKLSGYVKMMRDWSKGLSKEQCVSWAQRQVYIALENALLGAKALGFDSCPMEGFSPDEYSRILKLPSHLVPTVLCPIGFATDSPRPKARFAKEDIFF